MAITEQDVQSALKQLVDPNTKTDYITSKSAKNIKIDGNNVSVDVLLGYPAKSQVEPIRKEITAKLKSLPGVGSVTVNVTIKIVSPFCQRPSQRSLMGCAWAAKANPATTNASK